MTIVSRIKEYLSKRNIQSCVFADKCDIPRPTVSQLLNGRNKKVSDDVLSKIHIAYPELSMMWLMFGEGDMINDFGQNETESLDAQLGENFDFSGELNSDLENQFCQKDVNTMTDVMQSITQNLVRKKNDVVGDSLDKSIVNVMVFYSDNSFDSFVPNK